MSDLENKENLEESTSNSPEEAKVEESTSNSPKEAQAEESTSNSSEETQVEEPTSNSSEETQVEETTSNSSEEGQVEESTSNSSEEGQVEESTPNSSEEDSLSEVSGVEGSGKKKKKLFVIIGIIIIVVLLIVAGTIVIVNKLVSSNAPYNIDKLKTDITNGIKNKEATYIVLPDKDGVSTGIYIADSGIKVQNSKTGSIKNYTYAQLDKVISDYNIGDTIINSINGQVKGKISDFRSGKIESNLSDPTKVFDKTTKNSYVIFNTSTGEKQIIINKDGKPITIQVTKIAQP